MELLKLEEMIRDDENVVIFAGQPFEHVHDVALSARIFRYVECACAAGLLMFLKFGLLFFQVQIKVFGRFRFQVLQSKEFASTAHQYEQKIIFQYRSA
ncbi:hypothetical protein A5644_22200 [Mycobacterium intracellulare subsp. yongonense]|nr:hypothetical protein A5644_22200 [Mycobacterium intracellulare subsp. yongonense]